MYEVLNQIFSDKKGGLTFACFDIWHLCWMGAVLAVILIAWFFLKNQGRRPQKILCNRQSMTV